MAETAVLESKVVRLEKDTTEQWSAINNLREKFDLLMRKWVPIWVTLLLTAMGTITGSALTVAIMILRFTSK